MTRGTRAGPPKFKLTSPMLDENDVVDQIMEWLRREPRMARAGCSLIHYNGLVPVKWNSVQRRPAAGKWHRPGVADIKLSYRGRSGWIEAKREKDWKYQPGQVEFLEERRREGCFAIKAHSLEEVVPPVRAWLDQVDAEIALIERAREARAAAAPAPEIEV